MTSEESLDVIAIDGPAGSGKSTVAKETAERLDWRYLDTGAMYRCLCLYALRNNLETSDVKELVKGLQSMNIDMYFEDGEFTVFMNGEEVTEAIRENRVSRRVSDFAELESVREVLVDLQRSLGAKGESVVEGRDIGTVVFPDARYKFYLDAPLEVRARRRYNQLLESNDSNVDYESVLEDIRERDRSDRDRSSGPLKPPEDATTINTAEKSVHEVVNRIVQALGKNS
jgi:cytidylate kinase